MSPVSFQAYKVVLKAISKEEYTWPPKVEAEKEKDNVHFGFSVLKKSI